MKRWHITAKSALSLTDRLRVLFGVPIFARFESLDGDCHAACNITIVVQRDWPTDADVPAASSSASWPTAVQS